MVEYVDIQSMDTHVCSRFGMYQYIICCNMMSAMLFNRKSSVVGVRLN